MKKIFSRVRKAAVFAATLFVITPGHAQQPADQPTGSGDSYDPIAATLDSLVNQNFIERMNFAAAGTSEQNFQPYEVPSYSDEVYAQRISKIQSPMALTFNQQVKEYIDLYALRKRGLTERVMGLAQLYFPLFEQTLDQYDLPLEFKYLSIVESALNPTARSRVGATGIWQFMLQTGRLYNLKVNSYIDERRDPVKSTQAACEYFTNMYNIYGDWLLVIASYNCGAGNVNKAIARSGGKKDFWEISPYLPSETRGYVPAFIAVTYLMNYSAEHNLNAIPPVISFYEADTVLVDRQVSLREVASVIDVPLDLLTYLNPMYKRGIIPESTESQVLRLPTNKINTYIASLDRLFKPDFQPVFAAGEQPALSDYITRRVKKYHTVRNGDVLGSIANRYNCSVSDLRRWNSIKGTRIYKGQRILVYVTVKEPVPAQTTAVKTTQQASTKPTAASTSAAVKNEDGENYTWYVVQKGDTLYSIAERYEGTVAEIKSLNNLSTNQLMPGTKLKLKKSR